MYNKLFESIIRTSGENTDYLYDFDDRADNFWAPVPVIEQMFERVLREVLRDTSPENRKTNWINASKNKDMKYLFSSRKLSKEDLAEIENYDYDSDYIKNENFENYTGELIAKTSYNNKNDEIGFLEYKIFKSLNQKSFVTDFKWHAKDKNANNSLLLIDTIEEIIKLFNKENVSKIEFFVFTRNKEVKNQYDSFIKVLGGQGTLINRNTAKKYVITDEDFYRNVDKNINPKELLLKIAKENNKIKKTK
jgi:hypothetical protein